MKVEIYTLTTCDSCRKATKWLKGNNVPFQEIPIRQSPPAPEDIRRALSELRGDIRKLFNSAGQDYRSLNLKEKLRTLSKEEALALLASNGNLIKRPFLITGDLVLVGFKPGRWSEVFPT